MINIFQPVLGKEEIGFIEKVFDSNWLGKGDYVAQFEKQFALSLNADPSKFTTTTSCTEGIFLASDIFDFCEKDEIIVPSISFVSVGSSVVAKKAKLVLCDVDRRSLNATADDIEKTITPSTKALFLNHYGGFSCDMDPILQLCGEHGIAIIEDSACAVRSFYKGKACGTIGDMGLWSFDAMKILCTGDGGMIYLKSDRLLDLAKEQLYLGLPIKQKSGLDSSANGNNNWWEFDIRRPGRRAIMNNMTGAIGLSQLDKLGSFITRRQVIFERYMQELGDCPWLTLPPPPRNDCIPSYYFFWIQLTKRDELAKSLLENGIYSTFRYWPLHRMGYFGHNGSSLPNSDFACEHTLNIPLHQSLSDDDVSRIIDLIKAFGRQHEWVS